MDIPVVLVKVHALQHRLFDVEARLLAIDLMALRTPEGKDVSRTVVDAVLELRQVRADLLALESGTVRAK